MREFFTIAIFKIKADIRMNKTTLNSQKEKHSIHALLAESDFTLLWDNNTYGTFLSTLSLRRATAKVHKTVGHFSAYETNFMGIASSC